MVTPVRRRRTPLSSWQRLRMARISWQASGVTIWPRSSFSRMETIITSTWHDIEATPAGLVPYSDPGHEDHARLAALRDMDQIQAADVYVILTEDCERAPAGLWFEMGVAYDKCMD